jgi:hypothetical protein
MIESRVVIDIECFRFRSKPWVIKEIAVSGDYLDSIVLKPPYALETVNTFVKKAYAWITLNLHGLQWDSGEYKYERLEMFVQGLNLRYPQSQFYAKGSEKCMLLEKLFQRSFIDLDILDCPKITELCYLKVFCGGNQSLSHSQSHHCARKKAKCYKDWLVRTYSYDGGLYESEFIKDLDHITLDE